MSSVAAGAGGRFFVFVFSKCPWSGFRWKLLGYSLGNFKTTPNRFKLDPDLWAWLEFSSFQRGTQWRRGGFDLLALVAFPRSIISSFFTHNKEGAAPSDSSPKSATGTNSRTKHHFLSNIFLLNTQKSTAKDPTLDLLRLNTLRGIKITVLTCKKYDELPRPFLFGVSP